MSRLENHAVLRDAAIDVFTVCSAREMWLGRSRGSFFFSGKLIFWVTFHTKDKSIHRALH